MGSIEFLQAEIGGLATAVAHHQHSNLIGAGSTGPSDTASSAGRPWQVALSLERLQEKGFVGFDNSAFVRGPMSGCLLQEAVTPEEGRVLVDLTAPGCASHTHAVDQGLAVAQPLFALAQARQGRAAQRVAGSAAGVTSVTRQTMAPSPWVQAITGSLTMRTGYWSLGDRAQLPA
jgi:hypothetical protein